MPAQVHIITYSTWKTRLYLSSPLATEIKIHRSLLKNEKHQSANPRHTAHSVPLIDMLEYVCVLFCTEG